MRGVKQIEEEDLARALKASMETILEDQATREESYLFEDLPGNFTILVLVIIHFRMRDVQTHASFSTKVGIGRA